jgi:hypothetical protein
LQSWHEIAAPSNSKPISLHQMPQNCERICFRPEVKSSQKLTTEGGT